MVCGARSVFCSTRSCSRSVPLPHLVGEDVHVALVLVALRGAELEELGACGRAPAVLCVWRLGPAVRKVRGQVLHTDELAVEGELDHLVLEHVVVPGLRAEVHERDGHADAAILADRVRVDVLVVQPREAVVPAIEALEVDVAIVQYLVVLLAHVMRVVVHLHDAHVPQSLARLLRLLAHLLDGREHLRAALVRGPLEVVLQSVRFVAGGLVGDRVGRRLVGGKKG